MHIKVSVKLHISLICKILKIINLIVSSAIDIKNIPNTIKKILKIITEGVNSKRLENFSLMKNLFTKSCSCII